MLGQLVFSLLGPKDRDGGGLIMTESRFPANQHEGDLRVYLIESQGNDVTFLTSSFVGKKVHTCKIIIIIAKH